jgi:hypothetical protein
MYRTRTVAPYSLAESMSWLEVDLASMLCFLKGVNKLLVRVFNWYVATRLRHEVLTPSVVGPSSVLRRV